MTDIQQSLERQRFTPIVIPFFSPSDGDFLLGDANNGVKVPQGTASRLIQHAGSVTDGLSITVHNITRSESETVAFNASTFDTQTPDPVQYFEDGDELAIEVSGTTDASNGYLTLEHETDTADMGATS